MTDEQFQILVTRLNLLIDLFIMNMEVRPSVQLKETSYCINAEGRQKIVLTQPDGDILMAIKEVMHATV